MSTVVMVGILATMVVAVPRYSEAGPSRTQVVELEAGWNAVWLQVDPLEHDPAVLFTNTPVDIVASYSEASFTKQFVSDPSTDMLKLLDFGTWYAPERDDAFLSRLTSIYGQQAFLVHAKTEYTLSIEGEVEFVPIRWKANAFNLVGFSVDSLAAPSFYQFFEPSAAHRSSALYVMRQGVWKKVIDPASEAMKSGEAFWVYCDGASTFQGPLEVNIGLGRSLTIGQGQVGEMILQNRSNFPLGAVVQNTAVSDETAPLAVVMDIQDDAFVGKAPVNLGSGSWEFSLPALEAGASVRLPLAFASEQLTTQRVNSLLCVKSDLGTEVWIPVTGIREDLK